MSTHLQRQIERVKKNLLALGALVEEAVHAAILSVQNRDPELAGRVIEGDNRIDRGEIECEEECLHTLALYQPVAFDLRFVVAVLKINNDLERIGDLAVNIAEQARFLAQESKLERMPFDVGAMGGKAQAMLRQSLDGLVNADPEKAAAVKLLDDEVDAIHRGMYDRIAHEIRQNPAQLEQLIHMLNVSRQIERIADHTVNIADDVLYLSEGEILRHARPEKERE